MTRISVVAALLVSCFMAGSCTSPHPAALRLRQVADLPMPGGADRFDYQSLDVSACRLYLAHMGSDAVVVFDTTTSTVVANVTGVERPTGVLVVPSLGRVYVSASHANELVVIDQTTNTVVARIAAGEFPDGVAYDPVTRRIFVSNEAGRSDTVIDAATNGVIATIDLGGEAGNTQYDSGSGLMYVNVQTKNQLVAMDPKTASVVARYDLPGSDHNHGLYIDSNARLAFIACQGVAKLLIFDLDAHRVVGERPIGGDADVLAFDPGRGVLYVASEDGKLAILKVEGRDVHTVAVGFLADAAHSVAVHPGTHRVYFPLQDVGGQPVLRVMEPVE